MLILWYHKKILIYVNFMLIYVKIILKKNVFHRTDGQTHVQLKTIVRNLTKNFLFFEYGF